MGMRMPTGLAGETRRIRTVVLAGALIALALPTSAFAYYGYNYGIDWTQPPFNAPNQDFWGAAYQAEVQQDTGGYTALTYNVAWAEHIYNNMSASSMRLMSIVSHGSAAWLLLYGTPSRTYNGYFTNVSALSSSFSRTGQYVGISGGAASQYIQHTRQVSDLNDLPIKIIYYVSCYSGSDPPSGYNLLYSSTGHADMNFAGGFNGAVTFVTGTGLNPPNYWQYKYWQALKSGYYAGYSQTLARNYVYSVYGSYFGYNAYNAFGNLNEQM